MNVEIRNLKWAALVAGLLLVNGCGKPTEPLPPDGFDAEALLSTNSLYVGDSITLTLSARHPVDTTVRFPTLGNGKKVVVLGRSSASQEQGQDLLKSEETTRLTSFRVGDWPIATNPVVCIGVDGTEKTMKLPPLVLHVQSTLNETNATKLSDIKDIVKPPVRIGRVVWVMLFIVILALLGGLLTLLLRRRNHGEAALRKPVVPPDIVAKESLAALRDTRWIPEPFFTELSLILRTYLENRFNLNAPESTTEELTRTMTHDERLKINEQQTLRTFLMQADLVKFARADAEKDVMRTAFQTVEDFVTNTTPQEDPLPQESTENPI